MQEIREFLTLDKVRTILTPHDQTRFVVDDLDWKTGPKDDELFALAGVVANLLYGKASEEERDLPEDEFQFIKAFDQEKIRRQDLMTKENNQA